VRERCLEHALDEEAVDSGNRYGMRGGLTPTERVALGRQRRRATAVA
jgi:hypothetical protein